MLEEMQGLFDLVMHDQKLMSDNMIRRKIRSVDPEKHEELVKLNQLVEGIEELTSDPNRMLVCDGGGLILEKMRVHLYLTNDYLIIVSKRRKSGSSHKYFLVNAIALAQAKLAEVDNAFEISLENDCFTFQVEDQETLNFWVGMLTPIMAEENYGDNQEERRHAFESESSMHSKTIRNYDLPDEEYFLYQEMMINLEESIAHCEYDKAIETIEKIKNFLHSNSGESIAPLKQQLNEKIDIVCSFIEHELSSPLISKHLVNIHVQRLFRLGLEDHARTIFLNSRGSFLRKKVRRLKFEGNALSYITELSMLVFTVIKSTCEWYSSAFRDNSVSAGFVLWATEEIKDYVNIVRKQIFQPSIGFSVISDCLKACKSHARMLKEAGLDLGFLLDNYFSFDIEQSIKNYSITKQNELKKQFDPEIHQIVVASENYEISSSEIVKISTITTYFFNSIMNYIDGILAIMPDFMFETMLSGMLMIIELFSKTFYSHSLAFIDTIEFEDEDSEKTLAQISVFVKLINDLIVTKDYFLPKVQQRLEVKYQIEIDDFPKMVKHFDGVLQLLVKEFVERRVQGLLSYDVVLSLVDYSRSYEIDDVTSPSDWMQKIVLRVNENANLFDAKLKTGFLRGIIDLIIAEFSQKFSNSGVQQFVLDTHYFLKVFETHVGKDASEMANQTCASALKAYFSDPAASKNLKSADWYDAQVDRFISKK